ncbi:MAG: hypothetical protein H6Q20_1859 [Bacteroidetes bacterium]|nr:hypothetical protein [Bacteroidota bacterium]
MKKINLLIISSFVSLLSFSQRESIQQVSLKSPEVAAYERVGEIPVDTYTGVPKISIPIYTVKCGDLSLPISLDYHATAIKVDQEATWVGLNWNLIAGGVVSTQEPASRSGNYIDDWKHLFEKLTFYKFEPGDPDLIQYNKINGSHELNMQGLSGDNNFVCTYPSDNDISHELYVRTLKYGEGESKLYFANFMGYSFKMIYDKILQKNIIIGKDQKFNVDNFPNLIIAPNGVKYYFNEIENVIPQDPDNIAFIDRTPYPLRSVAYYLTKIESPNGKSILLHYKKYGTIIPIRTMTENSYFNHPGNVDNYVYRTLSNGLEIQNSYLYQIESDNSLVQFNVDSRIDIRGKGKKLENIEIYDKINNKLLKRFVFKYDYFQGNTVGGEYIYDYYKWMSVFFNDPSKLNYVYYNNDELYKRLQLLSMKEEAINEDGTKVSMPPYVFAYNSNSLPGKTSAARDYWGNYNGKENSGGIYYHRFITERTRTGEDETNKFPYGGMDYADNRFNPSTVDGWMLNSIKYPTGGYTYFAYEPHQFTNYIYFDTSMDANPTFTSKSVLATNINATIPTEYTTPKEFTTTSEMQVQLNIDIQNPLPYYWKSMMGANAQLFKYIYVNTPNGPVEIISGYKGWALTDSTELTGQTNKHWSEKIMLPPGKYKLMASLPSSIYQTTPYASFPGSRSIQISISKTNYNVSNGFGVRIKEISQTEGANTIVKNFNYIEEDGTSSGILMSPIKFARKKMLIYQNGEIQSINGSKISPPIPNLLNYWIQSSQNMISGGENKVGYNRVEVVNNGLKNSYRSNYGKIISKYWNKKNFTYDYYKPQEDPRNGNLIEQYVYNTSGNLQKEVKNTYTILNKEGHFVNLVVEDIYFGNEVDCNVLPGNEYERVCPYARTIAYIYPSTKYWIELTQRNEKLYTTNGEIVNTVNYTYNPANLAISMEEKISSNVNETQKKYFIYPQDYSVSNQEYPYTLINKNIINIPIEVVSSLKNQSGEFITNGIINNYDSNGNMVENKRLDIIDKLPIANFRFSNKSGNGILGSDATTNYSPFSNYITKATCQYTAKGNPVYIKEKDANSTVYLWGYNSQYPIAEIKNANYDDVENQVERIFSVANTETLSELSVPDELKLRDGSLQRALPNAFVTTYTYKPLIGIATVTDPREVTSFYEYDVFGDLKLVRDKSDNILSEYKYRYSNGQTDNPNIDATLLLDKASYLQGMGGIATLLDISGGSGIYSYDWYLKNSSGTIISSKTNTTSTTFGFTSTEIGELTIICVITDKNAGIIKNISINTLCSNSYSCALNMQSGFRKFTNNVSCNNTTTTINVGVVTSNAISPNTSYLLATLCPECSPSVTRTLSYSSGSTRTWSIKIEPNGNIFLNLLLGSQPLPSDSSINFGPLTFNK